MCWLHNERLDTGNVVVKAGASLFLQFKGLLVFNDLYTNISASTVAFFTIDLKNSEKLTYGCTKQEGTRTNVKCC